MSCCNNTLQIDILNYSRPVLDDTECVYVLLMILIAKMKYYVQRTLLVLSCGIGIQYQVNK